MREWQNTSIDQTGSPAHYSAATVLSPPPGAVTRRRSGEATTGRRIVSAIAAGAIGLTAAGCGSEGASNAGAASLADRYEHDYAGGTVDGISYQFCLDNTAYDTQGYAETANAVAVFPEGGNKIIVRPSGTTDTSIQLALENRGSDRPLQPINKESERILEGYGCDTGPYVNEEE